MLTRDFKTAGFGWHLFSSAVGPVGLAWTPKGICRLEFGPPDEERVIADILAVYPDMPQAKPVPAVIKEVSRRVKAHLAGRLDPMLDVPVDLSRGSEFSGRILAQLRKIKPGQVATYGELAARAGRPKAARAVGRIMGANPVPVIVPCHRCVGRDGSMTGFSTEGGIALKKKLLFMEGYEPNEEYAAGIAHLRRKDPMMKRLIRAVGPFSPLPDKPAPAYDTLVRAIIHQQLSVKAGQTIDGRVRDLTAGPRFPRPEEMMAFDDQTLRSAGLSTQKTSYVKDLAARVSDGRLKLGRLKNLSDDEVIAELTTVRGIGVWSAHMHLIFHLGRLDVLPIGDLGIQIACGKFYNLGKYATPEQITELGEKWRPYRSMASWYLWRGLDAGGI
jgi:O-6-methylguanine DNA methyltransferase